MKPRGWRHFTIVLSMLAATAAGADWTDITDDVTVDTGTPRNSRATGTALAHVKITVGDQSIAGPIRLVVTQSSSPVLNADGTTDASDPNPSLPYFDVDELGLPDGVAVPYVLQFQRARGRITYAVAVENSQPTGSTTYTAPPISDDSSGITRWFVLMNAAGPLQDASVDNPPLVLTVDGQPSNGAPAPNGGIGVGVQPLPTSIDPNQGASLAALWKALPAATPSGEPPGFYLRSALSFKVAEESSGANGTDITLPSLLVGFGVDEVALDLSSVPGFASHGVLAINQSASPMGDQSDFQTWYYDTVYGLLSLLWYSGDLLFYDPASSAPDSHTLIQAPPSTPEATWIVWPDYSLQAIYDATPSSPPFPQFTGGALAGYRYLSAMALLDVKDSAQTCSIRGVSYDGIRCTYTTTNDITAFTRCSTIALLPTHPSTWGDVPIRDEDWKQVRETMYPECARVAQAITTFADYNDIYEFVFSADSDLITALAGDIGMSTDTSVATNTTAIDIVEGIVYAVLGATGDPLAGLFANLIATAVTVGEDQLGATDDLNKKLAGSVAELNGTLVGNMNAVQQAMTLMLDDILTDGQKLKTFYGLSLISGYNSLGLDGTTKDRLESQAQAAFKVAAMQVLMPAYYSLQQNAALTQSRIDENYPNVPTIAGYTYPAFGSAASTPETDNFGYLIPLDESGWPDSQVITTDVLANGGNAFELFNALNGWSAMPLITQVNGTRGNLGCDGVVFTLFNASPEFLSVRVTPSQGMIAAPGYAFNSNQDLADVDGSEDSAALQVYPYGYLPIWTTANGFEGDDKNLYIALNVVAGSGESVLDLAFGSDGCKDRDPADVLSHATYNGWNLDYSTRDQVHYSGYPGGVNATLWNPND